MSLKKDLIEKQARFWVLMAGGPTLTAASETAGVSRATGRRWRQATGGRIPRKRPEPSGRRCGAVAAQFTTDRRCRATDPDRDRPNPCPAQVQIGDL